MKDIKEFIRDWGTSIFAGICGLIAFCMIYLNAIVVRPTLFGQLFEGTYSGVQIALGYSIDKVAVFKPAAGVILAYLFPLLGAATAIIGKGNKIATIIASLFMVTGGILALCIGSLVNGTFHPDMVTISLAGGTIACGVLAILGGVVACATIFLKNK